MSQKLTDGLNEGQTIAYEQIAKWLGDKNDSNIWLLEGTLVEIVVFLFILFVGF